MEPMTNPIYLIPLALVVAACGPPRHAKHERPKHQQGAHGPKGKRPPPPPPEAIEACEKRSAGEACSFGEGDRATEGTCEAPPHDGALACRPAGPPPHGARAHHPS